MKEEEARQIVAGLTDGAGLNRLDEMVAIVSAEADRQNLIARSTIPFIWLRHVLDSIQLVRLAPQSWRNWIDVGSGAGFPGLVVACAAPERPVTLVEPRRLRADFLRRAAGLLGLSNVDVWNGKAGSFDGKGSVISARAVGPPDFILRSTRQCATPDTTWILPSGRHDEGQMRELRRSYPSMVFHVEQSLTDASSVILTGSGRPS